MLFDTHAHYDDERFDGDRDALLASMPERGVELIVNPGCTVKTSRTAVELAARFAHVYAAVGIHPENCHDFTPAQIDDLRALAARPKVVAIGEIGLDYYWSGEFVAEQVEAFVSQCRLAARLGLPVAIHTRAAWDDMCRIIGEEATAAAEAGRRLRGVFHAFSEDAVTYRKLKACGDFAFGIGGVVTFRKSKLADTVREMELDDIVLETDCPYLTPAPHRGERNESAYVRFVCEKVAELKGLPPGEVAAATTANAKRIFGI